MLGSLILGRSTYTHIHDTYIQMWAALAISAYPRELIAEMGPFASLPELAEHPLSKREVVGSIPGKGL